MKMNDYSELKLVPRWELLEELKSICPSIKFAVRPRTLQLVSLIATLLEDEYTLLLDMGLGKSMCALVTAQARRDMNDVRRILVMVPNETNIHGWGDEVTKFTDFSSCLMNGSTKAREKMLAAKDKDIYILNYQALPWLLGKKQKVRGKMTTVVDEARCKAFGAIFDMVVFDESQKLKNPEAVTTRIAAEFSQYITYRYSMTGTPFNHPIDLWSQFYIIDRGAAFGASFTQFKREYFNASQDYWGTWTYTLKPGAEQRLQDVLQRHALRYEASECTDLPESTTVHVPLGFAAAQGSAYKKAMKGIIEAGGKQLNVESAYTRLRQISSGFIDIKSKTDPALEVYPKNPKIEWLVEMLQDVPDGRKVVVFHTFIRAGELICAALKKAKIEHVSLNADAAAVGKFTQSKTCRVLVTNVDRGGTGLNLQAANYTVFFEQPTSAMTKKQAEKRTHRGGQTRSCFQYELYMRESIEVKVIKGLEDGRDLIDMIVDGSLE